MKKQTLIAIISTGFLGWSIGGGAQAALSSRLDGLAYYDNNTNLTWLADANVAETMMNWTEAQRWVAGLNVEGVTGWRLPATVDAGNDGVSANNVFQGVDYGYNITADSELSNMFYHVLGNTAYYDTRGHFTGCTLPDFCLRHTGVFSHVQSHGYWSATGYASSTDLAWVFNMGLGSQYMATKDGGNYAWAVRTGDISSVPVPPTVWLFGSGLLGLIGVARRKN